MFKKVDCTPFWVNCFTFVNIIIFSFVETSDSKHSTSSEQSNLIVVREPPTSSSSSDSIFTDPASSHQSPTKHKAKKSPLKLTITKLDPFNFHPEPFVDLQICKNDSINVSSEEQEEGLEENEMPIVRNKMCSDSDNSLDKSIFNVSRVKKVELSEIPLNKTDICSSEFKNLIPLYFYDLNATLVLKAIVISHTITVKRIINE